MNSEEQLQSLEDRIKALEDEVFPPPGTDGSLSVTLSAVEDRLQELDNDITALNHKHNQQDQEIKEAIRILASLRDTVVELRGSVEQLQHGYKRRATS